MQRKPTVLLADADVLIDYRESDLAILALVARHLGRLAVLPSVLDEVRGVTAKECRRLGIEIVEVETERMLLAAEVESSVSFNDRLCQPAHRTMCLPARHDVDVERRARRTVRDRCEPADQHIGDSVPVEETHE